MSRIKIVDSVQFGLTRSEISFSLYILCACTIFTEEKPAIAPALPLEGAGGGIFMRQFFYEVDQKRKNPQVELKPTLTCLNNVTKRHTK